MGFYIETPVILSKAQWLIDNAEALKVTQIEAASYRSDKEMVPVCVLENGGFDAAAVCFSKAEFAVFADDISPRRKTWLIMPKEQVAKLEPARWAIYSKYMEAA